MRFKVRNHGQEVHVRIEGVELDQNARPGDVIAVEAQLPLGVAAEFERDIRRSLREALGEVGDIDKARLLADFGVLRAKARAPRKAVKRVGKRKAARKTPKAASKRRKATSSPRKAPTKRKATRKGSVLKATLPGARKGRARRTGRAGR